MKEVAVSTLWTVAPEKGSTDGSRPSLNVDKAHRNLFSAIPPTVQTFEGARCLVLSAILHIDVPSQVRFVVLAHLELHHLAARAQFGQHVVIEVGKMSGPLGIVELKVDVQILLIVQRVSDAQRLVKVCQQQTATQ